MTQLVEPVPSAPRSGLSTGARIGIGCGVATIVLVLVVCGGGFFLVRWGVAKLDEFAQEFEAQGYQRVAGQVVTVDQPLTVPTVYTVQALMLNADAEASIAAMAQVVEIRARVKGDVVFIGQTLLVDKGAVIEGDLDVRGAQLVTVLGTVEGEIRGEWGQLVKDGN